MLLRNLNPPKLCNGTRLTIKSMIPHVRESTTMPRKYIGVNYFMRPTDLLFEFERFKCPVRFSFALIINKSQWQSLRIVRLNQTDLVFSHSQLYIGLPRDGKPDALFIQALEGETKNIVYDESLNWTKKWTKKTEFLPLWKNIGVFFVVWIKYLYYWIELPLQILPLDWFFSWIVSFLFIRRKDSVNFTMNIHKERNLLRKINEIYLNSFL